MFFRCDGARKSVSTLEEKVVIGGYFIEDKNSFEIEERAEKVNGGMIENCCGKFKNNQDP